MDIETKRRCCKLLENNNLPAVSDIFETADGLALLANLVNLSAKIDDYSLYNIKEDIVNEAAAMHHHCWLAEGIMYFETCVGQVSFHVFGDYQEPFDTGRSPKPWSGIETQFVAVDLIRDFMCV